MNELADAARNRGPRRGLVTVANAGTKILMVDYEPKESSSFPFEDAVLNWSVCNHGQMGEATGRWIAEHMKSQGKDSADVIMIWGPISRSPGARTRRNRPAV